MIEAVIQRMKGRDRAMVKAEAFWRLFEQTGSVVAYIIYRTVVYRGEQGLGSSE